ncbi:MAG: hypothetical protein E6G57_01660 [Actinobacteria bacterium]|nr:MAG: hypothetical protein E6G57_01660 [Actinomycetota bacterium]
MGRARVVRWVVIGVCILGVAGIIAGSIANNNAVALTFGLITAVAVVCLMVATAVSSGTATRTSGFDEEQAARVEHLVDRLVAEGGPSRPNRSPIAGNPSHWRSRCR